MQGDSQDFDSGEVKLRVKLIKTTGSGGLRPKNLSAESDCKLTGDLI